MRWRYLALLAVGATAVTAAACRSGSGGESALSAAERQEQYLFAGQRDASWGELAPGQQAIVPRQLFISCVQPGVPRAIASFVDTSVVDATVNAQGVPQHGAKRVSFRIAWNDTGGGAVARLMNNETVTLDEVMAGGRWGWILPDAQVDRYRQGTCP